MSLVKSVGHLVVKVGKKGFRVGRRLSQLAELNMSLRIEKDKQKAYYKEIGELVHIDQINAQIESPKIQALRKKIVVQERKINELVEKLNQLKRISSCIHCSHVSHSWLKDTQPFCPKCLKAKK